ncbi:MAG: T9SS type A sorting domain-containing protein [candidate division Zixibacteria bacterium]|nr:T9SS type A sorting domain-containing protein [candidate division Zixibacteria bacterium]
MFNKSLPLMCILILILVFCTTSFAAKINKISIEEAQKREKIPDEFNYPRLDIPGIPYTGGDVTSPGVLLGTTWYDYQVNGSTGNRIAGHECGVHICWMNMVEQLGTRQIYYNFIDDTGTPAFGDVGTPVSSGTRDGYTTMDVDSEGKALIAYHDALNEATYQCKVAVDAGCGFNLFTTFDIPSVYPGQGRFIWPYIAYDYQGRYQVTNSEWMATGGDPMSVGHSYSSDQGANWSDLQLYDDEEIMCISGMISASHVDDKVVIVYTKPIDDGGEPTQYNNDVIYVESEDGSTWDYGNAVNITNYIYEDTIRAYTDVDAIYDYDGDLHIIWNAPGYFAEDGTITVDACFLYHWSEATGITMIYDAWFPSFPGAWNRSASKMSIAAGANGILYALWTHFSDEDVSAGGFSNGELYLSISYDDGETWDEPVNLTNSGTPDCLSGECESDHWSSLAESVDDELHITYVEDKDAGGIVQTEGVWTENPIRYLSYPAITSVEDDAAVPSVFQLNQNFPNPFNASTVISFELKEAVELKLDIFNVLGEKMATLAEGNFRRGEHTVSWDASKYASGIYFYKLSAGEISETKRMVMLK